MLALLLLACADKPADTATNLDDTGASVCPGEPQVTILTPTEGDHIALGDAFALDGEATSYVDDPAMTYLWAVEGDVKVVGRSGSWTPDAAGTYALTFQAEDECGISQASVTVYVDAPAEEASATVYGTEAGVPAGTWSGLSVGTDGVLWGAMSAGLVRLDPAVGTARVYGTADGLYTASPTAVLAATDGTVWVGHIGDDTRQGEQVSVATDGTLAVLRPIDYTESAEIQAVARLAEQPYGVGVGDVWMGTNEGLCVFDADLQVFAEHAHPTHPHAYSMGVAVTPDGDIWNGDGYQLSRWHYSNDGDLSPSADLMETVPTWPVEISEPIGVADLAADADGLWVASSLFGLAHVTVGATAGTSTVDLLGAPFPATASAVRVDGAGNTWIGSTEGLFVFATGVLTELAGDWLPGDGVQQIAVDDRTTPPTVWLGTSTGLVRLVGVPEGTAL
jgi:ligand-binding sensor domain-containing protein